MLAPLLDVLFSGQTNVPMPVEPRFDNDFAHVVSYIVAYVRYIITKELVEKGQFEALIMVCKVLATSVILTNIARYLSTVLVENLRTKLVRNFRDDLFQKTVRLHLGYFANERKGELMSHLTTDMQEVEHSVTNTYTVILREPITLIIMIVFLISMSWKMTLFAVLVIPVSALVIGTLVKQLRRDAGESQESLSRMLTVLDESFGGMRVVKGFNAVGYIFNKFIGQNHRYASLQMYMTRKKELAPAVSEIFGVVVMVILLLLGGKLVLGPEAEISASVFGTYLLTFSQVLRPAKELLTTFGNLPRGLSAAERIFRLMDQPLDVDNAPNAKPINSFNSDITFKDVSFSYGDRQVLHNINFTIRKGQTVALVGSSGGGKSTIADLLPRFYDPAQGQILIDGQDIKSLTQESLRSLMGIVTQESTLFNDTVANNIGFGDGKPELDRVKEAARIAHADQFISQLPEGYLTEIGDRGGRLSGGQRQRISIARAIYRNPEILILDEATSALDTESEKLVQDALNHLLQGRTALVIAHRLSTIVSADLILVVQDGRIVEQGTHQELVAKTDGVYQKLTELQQL